MSIEAQLNIRNNAMEVQGYLKDLFEWQDEVKAKEKKLAKQGAGSSSVPGPRGRATGPVASAPAEMQKPAFDPKTAGKPRESLKAPAASAASSSGGIQLLPSQSDQEQGELMTQVATTRIEKPAQPAASSKPPDLPPIRNNTDPPGAVLLARGNDHFKLGDYKSAEECYTRSIEQEPSCLAHANRAMALLKLSRWAEAEADCTEALVFDPLYTKAWLRRGAARRSLGKTLEAAYDFEEAVRLEPTNKAAVSDRDACLQEYMTANKLSYPTTRVALKISSGAAAPSTQGAAAASASASQPPSSSAQASAASEPSSSAAAAGPSSSGAAAAPTPTNASSASTAAAVAAAAAALASTSLSATSASASTAAAAAASKRPSTSTEFEATWRSLQASQSPGISGGGASGEGTSDGALAAAQCGYLALLDGPSLPGVFKSSLTAPLLSSMVGALLQGIAAAGAAGAGAGDAAGDGAGAGASGIMSAQQGVELLEGLTAVQRFGITVMSVPSKERGTLSQLWGGAEAALGSASLQGSGGQALKGRLDALRKAYRIT